MADRLDLARELLERAEDDERAARALLLQLCADAGIDVPADLDEAVVARAR